ncbi:hypothetical protein SteCoe_38599 [Stentor coeruleus]|uniref:Uncharacterized protein n=1 Tax=Stentor coeruleus TaxID=5963 RepID=A0A1R2AL79_9CILI|nr:hypothetical protein SteCoe_38599 [Stentor coeruleus]
MIKNSKSENLKAHLCDMANRLPKDNSIIISIGKQSQGKSTFLHHLFQDFSVPKNSDESISQNTIDFTEKNYDNFVLIDMKDLDSIDSNPHQDIFKLCITFTIADIVLLHISHCDLENRNFINDFAFKFLQSAKMCLKYKESLPQIILLIRDPRWANKNKETSDDYDSLVERFGANINDTINKMFMRFSNLFREEALNNSESEEEKNENIEVVNKMNEDLPKYKLFISNYYCVYFNEDFETRKTHYYELKHSLSEPSYFEDSNFPSLLNIIIEACYQKKQIQGLCDHANYGPLFGIDSQLVQSIQRIVDLSSKVSLSHIIEHVYIDVTYNIFFKYFDENYVLRAFEYFNKLRRGIEKISEQIINVGSKCINELSILNIRNKHQDKIGRLLEEKTQDRELMIDIISYFKYLSALSFANSFSLTKDVRNSYSFQTLESIFIFDTEDITEHQISKMKNSLTRFRCLFYFDYEFEEILKVLMKDYFKMNECIFELYKNIIEKTLQENYIYSDILYKQEELYKQANYISNIEKMLEPLLPYLSEIHLPETQDLISKLKNLHSQVLLEKAKDLIFHTRENVRYEELTSTSALYSFEIIERVIPSFYGILIGVVSPAKKPITQNPLVAKMSKAVSTTYLIPIIGCNIFNIVKTANLGLKLYSKLIKNKQKKIKMNYNVPNDNYIIDVITLESCLNGILSDRVNEIIRQKFNYEIVMSNDSCLNHSAFLKVKCILVIKDGSEVEE